MLNTVTAIAPAAAAAKGENAPKPEIVTAYHRLRDFILGDADLDVLLQAS